MYNIDVYKFAAAGDIDNLRIALIPERNCTNWYETSDVVATSCKQRTSKATCYPPLNNSPVLSSECRDGFASNSNDTSTLMVVLSSYLKEYLKPNFNSHCFNCERRPKSTLRCSACKRITYCQRSCQREDWKLHKYNCCYWFISV